MVKGKIFYVVLLVALVMGQLSEIKYQSVSYGGQIKQYAVVNQVSAEGADYFIPCPDCDCNLTVVDSRDNLLVDNQPATDAGLGLFTYQMLGEGYTTGQQYTLTHFCTSPTYGAGGVRSLMEVATHDTPLTFGASADDPSTTLDAGCVKPTEGEEGLFYTATVGYYACRVSEGVFAIGTYIFKIYEFVSTGESTFSGGVFGSEFLNKIAEIQVVPLRGMYLLATDPMEGVSFLWGKLWAFIMLILFAIGLPLCFIECFFIYSAVEEGEGGHMIIKYVQMHVKALEFIYTIIMQFMSFLSNLIPFT